MAAYENRRQRKHAIPRPSQRTLVLTHFKHVVSTSEAEMGCSEHTGEHTVVSYYCALLQEPVEINARTMFQFTVDITYTNKCSLIVLKT